MKAKAVREQWIKGLLRGVVAFQLLLPLGLYLACAYVVPASGPSRWWFFRSYDKSEDRSEVIRGYQAYLQRVRGEIPEEIRDFLLEGLKQSQGGPEADAVVNLFLMKGAARAGWIFREAPEKIRGRMIGGILGQTEITAEELLFVEWLRRGEVLGKGGFAYRQAPAADDHLAWRDFNASHRRRVAAYREWWGDGSRWPENGSEEPLKGTPYLVRSFSS